MSAWQGLLVQCKNMSSRMIYSFQVHIVRPSIPSVPNILLRMRMWHYMHWRLVHDPKVDTKVCVMSSHSCKYTSTGPHEHCSRCQLLRRERNAAMLHLSTVSWAACDHPSIWVARDIDIVYITVDCSRACSFGDRRPLVDNSICKFIYNERDTYDAVWSSGS